MLLEGDQEILIPEYLQKFKCIGSKCEDTCCKGWTVALDKKTYKNYKKCGNSKLKNIFDKSVVRNRSNQSEYYFGKIKMDIEGKCPFLNENNLCKIYSILGEGCLSDTCYFYPRHTNKINGLIENSASVSCPEVARLALLNPEPMGFIDIQQNETRPLSLRYILKDSTEFEENKELLYYFWELRIFTIGILQDRRYTLDERLLLLGLVVKRTIRLQSENKLKRLPQILEEYQNQFNNVNEMKNIFKTVDKNIKVPFSQEFIKQFSDPNVMSNFPSIRYYECVVEIIEGLKIFEENMDLTNKLFMQSYENYYDPYMREKEYILENYIVNEVFKELYPLARFGSIEDSYKMLLTLYNIIKFHLIGISAYYEKLDDEIVIKVIQSFSRVILHHNQYLNLFKVSE